MPYRVPFSQVFILGVFLTAFTWNILYQSIVNTDYFDFRKCFQSSSEVLKQYNTAASKGKWWFLQAWYWYTKHGLARGWQTPGTFITQKCSQVRKVEFKKQPILLDVSKKHISLFHRILDSQRIICAALSCIRRLLFCLQACAGQQSIHEYA